MDQRLNTVIQSIQKEFRGNISPGSRFYVEVDIGKRAEALGFSEIGEK